MRAPLAPVRLTGACRRSRGRLLAAAPALLVFYAGFGAALPLPALAQQAPLKAELVLLPVEGEAASPQLDAELHEAISSLGQKVQLSSMRLEDLMLGVGCDAVSVACLQRIGNTVAAQGLILSNLRATAAGSELSLRWFDVASGGDRGQAQLVLPAGEAARQQALGQALRQLLGLPAATAAPGPASAGEEPTGTLSISASVPFVEVILEGQPRGALPLELRELPAGRYSVVGRREGYRTWRGTAEVSAGKTTQLELELAPAPEQRPAVGYLDAIRTHTWVIAGVGLACLAGGAAFAAVLQSEQSSFDQTRGVTPAEIAELRELKDAGERNALAANILLGLGGAALLTAAVLSYVDYRGQRPERDVSVPRLSLGPGSIQLQLSY